MTAYKTVIDNGLDEIWRTGEELGLSNVDVHNIFMSVLNENNEVKTDLHKHIKRTRARDTMGAIKKIYILSKYVAKVLILVTTLCIACFIIVSFHNPTRKLITRNIQDFIYPVMTTVRYIALPLVARFPHLSQWYWEECLVTNSFFDQPGIECTPCAENVEPIKASKLDNFTDVYYNNGKILIITDTLVPKMTWSDMIEKLDIKEQLDMGSMKCTSLTKKSVNYMKQLMDGKLISDDVHIAWKINRLESLHIVRKIFPRLYFIPKHTEVAFHRYVFIDGPRSDAYPLPLTEFANVVIMQGEGKSVLFISPSNHCIDTCNPVTVTLDTSEVLFFNWIYWRPVRMKGEGISTFALSSFY